MCFFCTYAEVSFMVSFLAETHPTVSFLFSFGRTWRRQLCPRSKTMIYAQSPVPISMASDLSACGSNSSSSSRLSLLVTLSRTQACVDLPTMMKCPMKGRCGCSKCRQYTNGDWLPCCWSGIQLVKRKQQREVTQGLILGKVLTGRQCF